MKGYVKGGLWGLVLGGVGLSVISLAGEQPKFATGPAVPQLASPELDTAVTTSTLPVPLPSSPDEVPNFADAVPLDVATPDAEAAPNVPTEPAEAPTVVTVEEPAPQVTTSTTAPVLADDVVDTDDPAPLATGGLDDTPAAVAPPAIVVEDQAEAVAADAVTTAPAPAAEVTPEQPVDAPEEEIVPQTEVAEAPQDQAPAVVAQDTAPESAVVPDEIPAATATAEAPLEAPTPEQETPVTDQQVIVAQALPQASGGVRINRLGVDPQEPETPAPAPAEATALPEDAPALLRFAAPYENAQDLPKIAIMLIDTDDMADAAPTLAALGFMPTVAVNALAEGASDKMAAYRAAGLEVALQADLPSGARPADVEVAFEAAFQLLPEAAMLFSLGTGAIQDRAVTAQVMQILAADGLGFVNVQRGLSDATRVAEQAGVPAATVLRDLDGGGEDSRAIARALDQAAFRARQTGDVVILGRLTPSTVTALLEWAAALDQTSLSIAPVSAILLSQGE
ncbi:divergent polysaccharide deacetylase family protein [Yoonia algicola]|uniref:Divergent polysaccharide deacetylase family protein n=1 Tax=Yoonia algicola TaxID=3137368 RepID=A0AAN0M833_9RHOB